MQVCTLGRPNEGPERSTPLAGPSVIHRMGSQGGEYIDARERAGRLDELFWTSVPQGDVVHCSDLKGQVFALYWLTEGSARTCQGRLAGPGRAGKEARTSFSCRRLPPGGGRAPLPSARVLGGAWTRISARPVMASPPPTRARVGVAAPARGRRARRARLVVEPSRGSSGLVVG